ncbi:MAG: acyl-CoA thioester hydrolase [Brevundimonas sp.]|jgi:acyl-CoA thioester hydrolase|uniref:acyl-CoA thioesterase n=1 Tax=Brevundimonas sp. TaxID=1871086 RepID=UPI0039E6812A
MRPPPDPVTGAQATYPVRIRAEDIDHLGHVNNAVYLRWVQDAVVRHWERFADGEAAARFLWVALKHEITYRKPAFLEDGLTAAVSLIEARGARAQFRTLIRRGEQTLAEITSAWCAVDRHSHRPLRLPPATVARFRAAAAPLDGALGGGV